MQEFGAKELAVLADARVIGLAGSCLPETDVLLVDIPYIAIGGGSFK